MIRRWLFGMPSGSRPLAGAVRQTQWHDRWPAWLVSLLYLLRFVAVCAGLLALVLAIDELPRPWKYVALATAFALPIWGILHERVKRERALYARAIRR